MQEKEIIISHDYDDYIKKSTKFVEAASKFESEIFIEKEDRLYNGKSLIGVMSIGTSSGKKLTIKAEGKDELEAIELLAKIMEDK